MRKHSAASLLDERDVSRIISVRGSLLTLRRKSHLWVLRAGDDPRAWTLPLDAAGNGVGGWKHARPEAGSFLRAPAFFAASQREARAQLGRSVAANLRTQGHPTPDMWEERRQCLRRVLKLDRLARWTACFPQDALAFLDRHGFRSRRWHLLNLWLRVPEGRELFDDVPSLAWLAASSWCFKEHPVQQPLRSLRTLVRKPRRHLLRWLDLPEGDGTLRLLRTVRPADLDPMQAEAVCRVLRDEKCRHWWRSLPNPSDPRTLHLLAYGMPLSFPILKAVNEGHRIGGTGGMTVAKVLNDTRRMLHILELDDAHGSLARVESPARLLELHDRLAQDFAHLRVARQFTGRPLLLGGITAEVPPPLPPAPWMRPITSLHDLLAEGEEMHHCVASYEHQIVARFYYVYAVHHPQGRATLGLRHDADDGWAIAELRGKRNAAVPYAVRAEVNAWLRDSVSPPGGTRNIASAVVREEQLCQDSREDDEYDWIPF